MLPTLGPGEEANVSVSLTSPNTAGFFQSQWKMFTSTGAMCGGEEGEREREGGGGREGERQRERLGVKKEGCKQMYVEKVR